MDYVLFPLGMFIAAVGQVFCPQGAPPRSWGRLGAVYPRCMNGSRLTLRCATLHLPTAQTRAS